MFRLSRGIALRVNIRDLFQFQSAIHRNGIVNRAPKKKKIIYLMKRFGDLLTLVDAMACNFDFRRQIEKFPNVMCEPRSFGRVSLAWPNKVRTGRALPFER